MTRLPAPQTSTSTDVNRGGATGGGGGRIHESKIRSKKSWLGILIATSATDAPLSPPPLSPGRIPEKKPRAGRGGRGRGHSHSSRSQVTDQQVSGEDRSRAGREGGGVVGGSERVRRRRRRPPWRRSPAPWRSRTLRSAGGAPLGHRGTMDHSCDTTKATYYHCYCCISVFFKKIENPPF